MTHPDTDQSGPIPVLPDPDESITFLRSTTTTKIDRERDDDTSTRVEHLARFAIRDGALPDQPADFYDNTMLFKPRWMEAEWVDGQLREVRVSGPLRLKAGGTSDKITKHRSWGSYWRGVNQLPTELSDAVRGYETAVSTLTGGPR